MINQIRARYPQANITPVDYDPSATRVNQENRIKLMLAVAKERLTTKADPAPRYGRRTGGRRPAGGNPGSRHAVRQNYKDSEPPAGCSAAPGGAVLRGFVR